MKRLGIFLLLIVAQISIILAPFRMIGALISNNEERAFQILLAYDRLGSAATNGSSTETISSRANSAKLKGKRWGCILCRILDYIDEDHCKKSAGK